MELFFYRLVVMKLRLIYTSALTFVEFFIYPSGHQIASHKTYKYRGFTNFDHKRSKMSKELIFLGIVFSVLSAGVCQDYDFGNAFNLLYEATSTSPPPPPTDSEFFSVANVENFFKTVSAESKNTAQTEYDTATANVVEMVKNITATGAAWQKFNQEKLIKIMRSINEKYKNIKALASTKDYTKCDNSLKKLTTQLDVLGNDYYICNYEYSRMAKSYMIEFNKEKKSYLPQFDALEKTDCGSKTATTPEAKHTSLTCAAKALKKLYLELNQYRPSKFFYTENLKAMKISQQQYLNRCPAIMKMTIFSMLSDTLINTVFKCACTAAESSDPKLCPS